MHGIGHIRKISEWCRTFFAVLKAFPRPAAWMARQLDELVTLLWIQGYYAEAKAYSKKISEGCNLLLWRKSSDYG